MNKKYGIKSGRKMETFFSLVRTGFNRPCDIGPFGSPRPFLDDNIIIPADFPSAVLKDGMFTHPSLHDAVHLREIPFIRFLLQVGFDPNVKDKEGYTPFHMSIMGKSKKIISLLLQFGADPRIEYAPTPQQQPLRYYALRGGCCIPDFIPFIFVIGTPLENHLPFLPEYVNFKNDKMVTSLLNKGIDENRVEIIQFLLDHITDINDKIYEDCVHRAIQHNNVSIMQMFIRSGLRPDICCYYVPMIHRCRNPEMVEFLFRSGWNINIQNLAEETLLFYAIRTDSDDSFVRFLVDFGVSTSISKSDGTTCYHFAISYRKYHLLPLLV